MQDIKKKFSDVPTRDKAARIIAWLEEHKARDILALDLEGVNAFTEALVIVTATSVRHGQSLADGLLDVCSKENLEFLRMEGYQTGQWVLVDMNDVVVNIFQEPVRGLFRLENLWREAPVLHDGRAEAAGGPLQ